MKHLLLMACFSFFVAVTFGTIGRDRLDKRALYGVKVFTEFIGVGLVLAWILYFLPY